MCDVQFADGSTKTMNIMTRKHNTMNTQPSMHKNHKKSAAACTTIYKYTIAKWQVSYRIDTYLYLYYPSLSAAAALQHRLYLRKVEWGGRPSKYEVEQALLKGPELNFKGMCVRTACVTNYELTFLRSRIRVSYKGI